MNNRRGKGILAAVLAAAVLCACAGACAKTELTVFAAASLTETLTEIKAAYEAEHPEVTLVFNFDSSGTLKTQIREGADCDVFISAAQKQMDELDPAADEEHNPEGLDFVLEGTRTDLLENKVVLAVPADNPKGIKSFGDLASLLEDGGVLLAMGNSDVPVGQYTQKILAFFGLDGEQLGREGKISYGSNVKEVTVQVAEGSVDCGVVYATDAAAAGLAVADSAGEEMCGRVIYPAAVMKHSAHPAEAGAFLSWLGGKEAMAIFEKAGFSAAEQEP